jgi:hypothetical protein
VSAIKYNPDEATLLEFEAWLGERPQIADLVRAVPPWHCYRMPSTPLGHYRVYSYSEDGTCTVSHGADSFMPGLSVFGIRPSDLIVCDCGKWEHPTEAQCEATERRIDQLKVKP